MNMKQARLRLGLTLSEFAALHGQTTGCARRWEKSPEASGYRHPSGSAQAFTKALLDGYRPNAQNAQNKFDGSEQGEGN